MAKSSMKSVNVRRHHRRIEHQAHIDRRNNQERMYKQKVHESDSKVIVSVANICARAVERFNRFISRFFKSSHIGLDLTVKSPYDPNRPREAGAYILRGIWPGLGTMVSTRDGKIIK